MLPRIKSVCERHANILEFIAASRMFRYDLATSVSSQVTKCSTTARCTTIPGGGLYLLAKFLA